MPRIEISDSVVKIYSTVREPPFCSIPGPRNSAHDISGTGVILSGQADPHECPCRGAYASQVFVQANQSTERVPKPR